MPPKRSAPDLGRAISLFQQSMQARRKALSTERAYIKSISMLEDAFGSDCDPATIRIEDLERIVASWRHLDANTVRNRLVAWREFYKWGARRHGWPRLADEIDPPKRSKPALRRLTPDEVEAMLHARAIERARTIVWLLAYTAVRCGELQHLRWRDIDLVAGRLTVVHITAKGRKGRVIPIPDKLVDYLAGVKDARGDNATRDECFLLPHRRRAQFIPEDEAVIWTRGTSQTTIGRMLKAIATEAGVRAPSEVTAHMFRRFYLQMMLDDGTDSYIAKAIAGHASIQTTAEYGGGASMEATTRAVRGLSFEKPANAVMGVLGIEPRQPTESDDPSDASEPSEPVGPEEGAA